MTQETFGPDSWQARGARIAALELELEKLRADVVWIAQRRDENERWARDRAAVAIAMADQRDEAHEAIRKLYKFGAFVLGEEGLLEKYRQLTDALDKDPAIQRANGERA